MYNFEENYKKINPKELSENAIKLISEDWLLVGAGDKTKFNALTASWGALGFIWNKPTLTVYIRDNRYTYEFLQANNNFCVSVLGENCRDIMTYCGRNSGRDGNKILNSGLKPITTPSSEVSYEQAEIIFECRKLYVSKMELSDLMPELQEGITDAYYTKDSALHYQHIAEITSIWIRK